MSVFPKKPTFRDWQTAAGTIGQGERLAAKAGFVCIYGTAEFLLNHTVELARRYAETKLGLQVTAVEAGTLGPAVLRDLLGQGSLFDPATAYVVRRCEASKSLGATLKTVSTAGNTSNLLILVHKGEAPAAAAKTELERLGAAVVPCFDPYPNEVPMLTRQLAKARGLNLGGSAADVLLETTGADLGRLDNELEKLALIFADRLAKGVEISAQELAPHLGLLREDDAFQLDRLLLARQLTKAQALAATLVRRGEKGLSLLAILASHSRNALRCIELMRNGAGPGELASAMRLPLFIVKNYAQALRGADPRPYARCLARCQEADVFLKTSGLSDDLCLAYVLDALA
jgi:DNA polymerase-3 subunit delta